MIRRPLTFAAALAILFALQLAGIVRTAAAKVVPAEPEPGYLRVVDDEGGERVALEIATRRFARPDGGPTVALVAVAHIGDGRFYEHLQEELEQYDVVLYESVLPPGARRSEGLSDEQRVTSTRASMRFVGSLIESHRARTGSYPDDLAALSALAPAVDERLPGWLATALLDAWGRPLHYERRAATDAADGAAAAPAPEAFALTSLGADDQPGGAGPAADLRVGSDDGLAPLALGGEDNLQAQLALTLDLAFQLEAMDYEHANWRASDMTIDQVGAALQERGIDFEPMAGALTGTSLPARLIGMVLRMVRLLDAFLDGAIADTGKLMLIEVLGNEQMLERSLAEYGEGFADVIVGMRNQVAVDDLAALIDREPQVDSVAIFYGAAHMADLEDRLHEQLGYEPLPAPPAEAGAPAELLKTPVTWHRAIEVDLEQSAVTRRDLEQIRAMVRQMTR